MSSSSKVVLWIIVVLVILIGGFIYFTHMSEGSYPAVTATTTGDVGSGIPPRNYDQDSSTVSATDTSDTSGSATDSLDDDSIIDAGASASSTQ